MTEPMLRFVSQPQKRPTKRPAIKRRADFKEIYKGFSIAQAEEQSSRCSQCGIPFCSAHCPLGNNIPDWLRLAATHRLKEAYLLSSATNSFPEICGRICPQDRLCEGNCVIHKGFESVTIGGVERFITETAFQNGWVEPNYPENELGKKVGIIGSGPAGLACAENLRAKGYEVHIYERQAQAGGLLRYGIPGFKLEKNIVDRRIELLKKQGVIFHLGQEIGEGPKALSFDSIRNRYDTLFIATGVYQARRAHVQGEDLKGVVKALEFLIQAENPEPDYNAKGKKVVVIGGGDTAMDCVRSAIRQGAQKVTCVYRRDRENMPGSRQEVMNAEEEGGIFHFLAAPEAFIGHESVEAVRLKEMRLGVMDANGRRAVDPTGTHTQLDADMVICALGFDPEDLPSKWNEPKLAVTSWKTLSVKDQHYETSLPGVFAGGDIVRGASLVVWAIADGRGAAEAMHKYLVKQAAQEIEEAL
ncbi:FAD-dependent oxidoreductase [Aristophania vespae]|uniref:FAD-dependent oxidoreductase n=1 Tax=Aristophania vespae TaxID=2697033 RepID=A0A6P1NFQ8_9PROT|nr:NAD(P)-dependent oxidoreductase [Aristophania vespae]QHI95360.1 FAD-dependent oxidoreductase [Aristophania vespae]